MHNAIRFAEQLQLSSHALVKHTSHCLMPEYLSGIPWIAMHGCL